MLSVLAQVEEAGTDGFEPFIAIDTWLALIGLLVPFVTALLARRTAPDWQKTIITTAVAGVATLLTEALQDGDLTLSRIVNGVVQTLAFAALSWIFLSDPVARLNSALPGGIQVGGARDRTIEPQVVTPADNTVDPTGGGMGGR